MLQLQDLHFRYMLLGALRAFEIPDQLLVCNRRNNCVHGSPRGVCFGERSCFSPKKADPGCGSLRIHCADDAAFSSYEHFPLVD